MASSRLVVNLLTWVASFMLGTTNNFTYVVIGASAPAIADDFNMKNSFPLINVCNTALGSFCRALNATAFARVPFKLRTMLNIVLNCFGIAGVILGYQMMRFPVVLVAILFFGSACSFGESFMINNLQLYPPSTVSGWSSGTGLAGVGGTLFYIGAFALFKKNNMLVYLTLVGVPLMYGISYFCCLPKPYKDDDEEGVQMGPSDQGEALAEGAHQGLLANDSLGSIKDSEDKARLLRASSGHDSGMSNEISVDGDAATELLEAAGDEPVVEVNFCTAMVKGYCHFFCLTYQLTLVYFLEYVITQIGAQYAIPQETQKNSNNWWVTSLYANLQFCYQIGVFLSRSSLQICKIKHVSILTGLQLLNFILWLANTQWHFLPVWSLYPLMVFVGLMGGASYVNTFYWILKDDSIPEKEKALGINLTTIHIDVGILSGNLFSYILSRFVFS